MMRRWFLSVSGLAVMLICLDATAAGLDARLDRTRMSEGETVVLTLTVSGDARGTPDLSPLNTDFDLLEQSQSTHMSIVNGRSDSRREWQLVLAPKRTGTLSVPGLTLGGLSSAPLTLQVREEEQPATGDGDRPLFLEVEVDAAQPLMQSQVIYTLRILSRIQLRQASLAEPVVEDALVERMGEDSRYIAKRGGRDYQVIERRYALFPQRSGKIEIAAPVLTAEVTDNKGRSSRSIRDRMFGGDPFGSLFERTKPVRIRGKKQLLEVQPRPDSAALPWLPARSLVLAEDWAVQSGEVRVGEPFTRTIAITAQGLTGAQLPDLQPPVPEGVKVYPDKPNIETRTGGDALIAQKVIKAALVPSRSGTLVLPEVRLSWWDTQGNRPRVATLPQRRIEVLPAATPESVQGPMATAQAPANEVARLNETPMFDKDEVTAGSVVSAAATGASSWQWLASALAAAWVLTLGLWWRDRRLRVAQPGPQSKPSPRPNPKQQLARVREGFQANDPRAARAALLDWAAARWPDDPPRRLEALSRRLNGEAGSILDDLDRNLYASGESGWYGMGHWPRLEPLLEQASVRTAVPSRSTGDELPQLYPSA